MCCTRLVMVSDIAVGALAGAAATALLQRLFAGPLSRQRHSRSETRRSHKCLSIDSVRGYWLDISIYEHWRLSMLAAILIM